MLRIIENFIIWLGRKIPNENPSDCDHRWYVVSTALNQGCLELQCFSCGSHSSVDDPTKEEWSKAYDAPEKPYRWRETERVTFKSTEKSDS